LRVPHNRLDLDVRYIAKEYQKGRSAKSIGEELGVSKGVILGRLKEQGIERRQRPTYENITKDVLSDLYVTKKLSTRTIADKFGCNNTLISKRLKQFGIPVRKNAGDPAFSKEERKEKWGRALEDHPLWKGGVTSINTALRGVTAEWSLEQMRNNNFECFVLGKQTHNLEVHHVKPFSVIRDEAIAELGLSGNKTVGEYTAEELEELKSIIIREHEDIIGYPLDANIHRRFHSEYGMDTDLNDLLEFKQRYLAGEFDEIEATA